MQQRFKLRADEILDMYENKLGKKGAMKKLKGMLNGMEISFSLPDELVEALDKEKNKEELEAKMKDTIEHTLLAVSYAMLKYLLEGDEKLMDLLFAVILGWDSMANVQIEVEGTEPLEA